jgi:hypothetical protein
MGRSSIQVSFYCPDHMQIKEVISATKEYDLFNLNGEYLSKFIGSHCTSLQEFDDGYYVCKLDNGNWIEFSMF